MRYSSQIHLSKCFLTQHIQSKSTNTNIEALRVNISRFCTKWTQNGIQEYKDSLIPKLHKLREEYKHLGVDSISEVISLSYNAINSSSKSTNKTFIIGKSPTKQQTHHNPVLLAAAKITYKLSKEYKKLLSCNAIKEEIDTCKTKLIKARNNFRFLSRQHTIEKNIFRDEQLYNILSNPTTAFKHFRNNTNKTSPNISKLVVDSSGNV